jgi:hypothetical protein
MKSLPPEIEQEGWLAYEQARAFENLRRKRVPEIYAVIFVLAMIATLLTALTHPRSVLAAGGFGAAVLYAVVGWLKWASLKMQYGHNVRRLAEMEAKYGEDLPWLEVERHLAALGELRKEVENSDRKT